MLRDASSVREPVLVARQFVAREHGAPRPHGAGYRASCPSGRSAARGGCAFPVRHA
ncbi:hypothetical protein C7S16_4655 [Burkholderia thailandensis]|uniref:Uncharacterized protein n=1 Tax=Burkholderia thailandensis TaxID=57975 RepID=A0AAW9CTY5_BURTH|nr:hypothetical protein [Burkholderia thailandensis]MDW9252287.1 hypothetical protein [Burkholderia thailandensis]